MNLETLQWIYCLGGPLSFILGVSWKILFYKIASRHPERGPAFLLTGLIGFLAFPLLFTIYIVYCMYIYETSNQIK
jgi:hypothetical protein